MQETVHNNKMVIVQRLLFFIFFNYGFMNKLSEVYLSNVDVYSFNNVNYYKKIKHN